jgi:environmental stress-induced protein Ves
MPLIRFNRSTLPTQAWKNGGGVTREVMCLPAGSDETNFDWRVSIAHIESSGPFSAFAGIDRVITLLEGPGLHLRSADGAIDHHLARPLEPFAFPGEAPIRADLLGAPCHDFNVMTRRRVCIARVQVLRGEATLPRARQGLLMAVRADWALPGEPPLQLGAGEGLWWHDDDLSWQLRPKGEKAALVAVSIDAALS